MKIRFGKLFLVFGVLFLLCASALFLFRTSLVEYGVELILERQGARQVSMTVNRVNPGGIRIKQLDFVLHRGSRVLDLELQNMAVSFAPAELFHAQVEDIALEQLTLRQSVVPGRAPAEPSAPLEVPKLLDQLSADWHRRLPFRSASIATLKLSGSDLPSALLHPLTLGVTRTDSGVNVACRPLSSSGFADVHLLLEKDGATTSLSVAAAETGRLTATLTKERLDGSFSLELARLNSLCALVGKNAVQAFDQLGPATLSASFSADMERWPQFAMQGQLAAKSLTLADTALKELALMFHVKGDSSAKGWEAFQTGLLQLDIDQLSGADFVLTGVNAQVELSAGEKRNYRLVGSSAFKVAAFENANISLQKAYIPLSGNLSLTNEKRVKLQLRSEERWRVAKLKSAGLSIGEATLRPAFTLQLTTTGVNITYAPALHLNLAQLSYEDLQIPSLALQPSAAAQLHIDRGEALRWRLKNSSWRIRLPLIENASVQIRPDDFVLNLTQLSAKGRSVSLEGEAQMERIAISAKGKSTDLRDVALNLSLTPEDIEGEGDFHIGPFKQPLVVSIRHGTAASKGAFRLTTPSPLVLSQQLALSHAVESWSFPFNAVTGRIDLTLSADWAPGKEPIAVGEIILEDIDGQWREIVFSSLSLRHRIKLWPVIESQDQALLTIGLITAGVPITKTGATLQLRQNGNTLDAPLTLELEEGHFTLFDSVFSLQPFTYRTNAATNRILIVTDGFDLAQLAPLYKNKGLQMSGLVAAELPMELGADGVEVVEGTIRQKGPGVIFYRPEDPGMLKRAGMPEVVIKALENFHYDHLEADVAYQPDGELDIGVHLRGKSPTDGSERPIHLNLNVEQNLLSLLKSLRYSDIFDRKIEEYIKKKR